MEFTENVIEWISGQHYAVVTFSNKKHINRIKNLYKERKDDFKFFHENEDGSICAKIPMKWVKINPGSKEGRMMTEEQREAARINLEKARSKKKNRE